MGTAYIGFKPTDFVQDGTAPARFGVFQGTNFDIEVLKFGPTNDEFATCRFVAKNYASGNLTLTVFWYPDTAVADDVIWSAELCVITPNVDAQDIETDAFAAANTATDTVLGAQQVHSVDITISNLDSLAADDLVHLRLSRDATALGDSMAGDALLLYAVLGYTTA